MRLESSFIALIFSALPALGIAAEKTVYGLSEQVQLIDLDLQVPAKLDTGAETASLSARDIQRFKRDGQSWVRFYLGSDLAHSRAIERPLLRTSHIKRRAGDCACAAEGKAERTSRPVIEMRLCLGQAQRTVQVNLTDRNAFQYPLLLGAQALKDFNALVDPGRADVAGAPACDITSVKAG